MTYDVLEKVTKRDLIDWLRENVLLPRNISDEQFLWQVKLNRLFAENEALLKQDEELSRQLSAATNDTREFMRLMVEAQKLNAQMDKISKQISTLMKQEV